jgi:FAR-17a/AIG1-like protein
MRGLLRSAFLGCCFYGFSLYGSHPEIWQTIMARYAGRLEFLTNIGLLLTILTLLLSILADLDPYFIRRKNFLLSTRNIILGVALPIEVSIFLLYWLLKYMAPSLLIHPDLHVKGIFTPILTDLCLHAFPTAFLLAELFIFSTNYSSSNNMPAYTSSFQFRTLHGSLLIFFVLIYLLWTHHLFIMNQGWTYPFFAKISPDYHSYVFFFGCSVTLGIFLTLEHIHSAFLRHLNSL